MEAIQTWVSKNKLTTIGQYSKPSFSINMILSSSSSSKIYVVKILRP